MDEQSQKLFEEKIRKDLINEIIIDKLFNCLELSTKGTIKFDYHNISENEFTYLLKKYDEEKFKQYEEILTEIEED